MKLSNNRINVWVIIGFCTCYLLVQLSLITRAHFSDDKRFGFWMFAETTLFSAELYRITVDGKKVKTKNGIWRVNEDGKRLTYSWDRMVRDYRLNSLEREKRAKGSISLTLKFFDAALDYVADRIPDDHETRQLVLTVTYHKVGREKQTVTLESKKRIF